MTIDFWGLGLQAINVLILVWLLSRVFWRPVAQAIAARQKAATDLIATAKATQDKADAALAEATKTQDGLALDHAKALDSARAEAASATRDALAQAQAKAEALIAAAKTTIDKTTETARKANEAEAVALALKIAADLLRSISSPVVQAAFLARLTKAIGEMPARDRAALADDPKGIEILTAAEPDAASAAEREKITAAVQKALGGAPEVRFVTDPDLIAGLELRSAHFALRNSWQADLAQIAKAVKNAA